MPMQFSQLDTDVGLKKLNGFLTSKSYIEGYSVSAADFDLFKQVSSPDAGKYPNVFRWYVHIAAKLGLRAVLSQASVAPSSITKETSKEKVAEEDEDDDLFGGDDEDEEAVQAAAQKRAEAAKAASKKDKKVIERSQVVIEVKPFDSETNLEELAAKIKATKVEGLKWGEGHKLVDVAYGIQKLLVQCVIVDDIVSLDDITDCIEKFEDEVQSVDVASMNKL